MLSTVEVFLLVFKAGVNGQYQRAPLGANAGFAYPFFVYTAAISMALPNQIL
jgi:hypothetical protein